MPGTTRTTIPLLDADGQRVGKLVVSLLPNARIGVPHPLRVLGEGAGLVARHQLLEDTEYRFQWKGLGPRVGTSHPEIFVPDDESGLRGSIRPRRNTGTVTVHALVDEERVGTATFEVRSRKMNYRREYRWMLADLTRSFTELVLRRFAAGEHSFQPSPNEASRSLYQRFAFLRACLDAPEFQEALHRVKSEPYVTWRTFTEPRSLASAVRPSASLLRQVASRQPRAAWPGGEVLGLSSLPRSVDVERTEATTDNVPNRFVRFALESFRATALQLGIAVGHGPESAASVRGRAEAEQLTQELDRHLNSPLLRSVSPLRQFPAGNQVLQKKAGYRDVLRTYLLADVAAKLTWEGGDEVYGAGKRDVAALYEYWAFMRLAQVVGELCEQPVHLPDLVEDKGDGLAIKLKAGVHQSLHATYRGAPVPLDLTLHFNRRFATGGSGDTAWSRPMQPDCSLEVQTPEPFDLELGSVWLHFDAKYRVERVHELFGSPDAKFDELKDAGGVKRADLLKMHAYRDAIRRSVGAYVLYPGRGDRKMMRTYDELLPGLGAFPLRPRKRGKAAGTGLLANFLEQVFAHLASPYTQRERARYWQTLAVKPTQQPHTSTRPTRDLTRPPDDTIVGLGFVKSSEHWTWIGKQERYLIRADLGREGAVSLNSEFLRAEFVVLYDEHDRCELWRVGPRVEVFSEPDLAASAYPRPGGTRYLGLRLLRTGPWESTGLDGTPIRSLAASRSAVQGTPVAMRWSELHRS